ncbi:MULTISPECIES: hypothetical protein [unclassified Streptomyces]|uniref:hypothetical protein n=1 Tax=Streptomyces sp. NPDC127129 TaxID=3345373 RepID=UPI00363AD35F
MRTADTVALRAPAFRDDVVLRPLVVALLMYVSGLTAGWFAGGVPGMATGGMCGTVVALGVLLVREAGRRGPAVHAGAPRRAAARRILTRSWRRLRRHGTPASAPRPQGPLPPGAVPDAAGAPTAGPHRSRPDEGVSDGSLPQGSEPDGIPPSGAGPDETASHDSQPPESRPHVSGLPESWPPQSRPHASGQHGTEPYRLPPDGSGRDRNLPEVAGPDEARPHETWPDEDVPEWSLPPGTAAESAGPHGSRLDEGASDRPRPQGSKPHGTPPGGPGRDETASHGSWPPQSRPHVSGQHGTEPYRLPPDGSRRDRTSPEVAGPDEARPRETWPDKHVPDGSLPHGRAPDSARAATAGPLGSRPDGEPLPGEARAGGAGGGRESGRALRLLVDAVWRGDAPAASDEELRAALAVARDNQVEGRLAQVYPRQLASTLHAVDDAGRLFRRNVVESTDRLSAAAVPTVLVKADLPGDLTLGSFDLVVPTDRWKAAQKALGGWYVERSTHWLERSTSVLLKPPDGPSAQLHTAVAWRGVSVMATDRLFAHAVPDHDGRAWLVPCPADRLRIWLALGIFRNQTLDLSELLALRELLAPEVVAEARAQTAREGWSVGGDRALELATEAMATLDRGEFVQLPLPLPVTTSLRTGVEHAGHLLTRGRASTAAREVALRVPLAVTERLRRRTS